MFRIRLVCVKTSNFTGDIVMPVVPFLRGNYCSQSLELLSREFHVYMKLWKYGHTTYSVHLTVGVCEISTALRELSASASASASAWPWPFQHLGKL